MRRIINRKLYDADTATELLTYIGGDNPRDFHYYEERLYQKRTKEFFLHGEGGPMSPCRCRVEASAYTGGDRIIPMTEQGLRIGWHLILTPTNISRSLATLRNDPKLAGQDLMAATLI